MRKLILILMMVLSIFSYGKDYKKIKVSGRSEINVLPSKGILKLEIFSKDKNLKEAMELNKKIFEKYKNLLEERKIVYDNIKSVEFFSNKDYHYENKVVNKDINEYETILKIDIVNIKSEQLKNFISILKDYNIYSITKNINKSYGFEVNSRDKDESISKKIAFNNFEKIKKELEKIGIKGDNIKLVGVKNNRISLEKIEEVKSDVYNVVHKFQITVNELDKIGEIIDLANTLDINTPNYIEYKFNNEELEKKLYLEAYNIAYEKALKMAMENDLTLKNPVKIVDNSVELDDVNLYFENKYNNLYDLKVSSEKSLKKSYSEIKNEMEENNTIVIPRKQNLSKELFIEFEAK